MNYHNDAKAAVYSIFISLFGHDIHVAFPLLVASQVLTKGNGFQLCKRNGVDALSCIHYIAP
jgi:hypothetical protein